MRQANHIFSRQRHVARTRRLRTSLLPDFYIGAHAAVGGLKLLTRDARRYTGCFPKVLLISPE
jgi:predicted nucleic acid-binding protein